MYTKRILIEGITREFEILKHLGSKVTKKNADFRLSEPQRSIEELEYYIVSSFPAQVSLMVEGIWNMDSYKERTQKVTKFTWKRFNIELNKALRAIKKDLRTVKGKARKEEVELFGRKGTRGSFLIDYIFSFLGAYKMQLFLQLKASGLTELGTSNLWGGRDAA
jgi:hypothetical protein